MTESKHTPGPSWYAEPHGERGLDGPSCFRIVSGTPPRIIAVTYGFTAEDDANAVLMAAAPEMYRVLRGLLSWADEHVNEDNFPASLVSHLAKGEDAIAKAEGGAS